MVESIGQLVHLSACLALHTVMTVYVFINIVPYLSGATVGLIILIFVWDLDSFCVHKL